MPTADDDFGPELGVNRSSAQLTVQHRPEDLVGRQIVAAVAKTGRASAEGCFSA